MSPPTGNTGRGCASERIATALNHLPPHLLRHRVLDTAEAAEFCKLSVPHWRRLYRAGRVPRPVRLAARKYGWPIGDLVDWIEASRAKALEKRNRRRSDQPIAAKR